MKGVALRQGLGASKRQATRIEVPQRGHLSSDTVVNPVDCLFCKDVDRKRCTRAVGERKVPKKRTIRQEAYDDDNAKAGR